MLPDDAVPTMILACALTSVLLAHVLFYRVASRFSAQMPLKLSSGRLASPLFVLDRSAGVAMPEITDGTASGTTVGDFQEGGAIVQNRTPAVYASDLRLRDRQNIDVPFKVSGDLEITGDVQFNKVVVVDGLLVIDGSARFLGGLIVKNRMIVNGQAAVGCAGRESWAVTRRIAGRGRLTVWQQNLQPLQLAAS